MFRSEKIKFISVLLIIDFVFLLFISIYYYRISTNQSVEYENKISNQNEQIKTLQAQVNNKKNNINEKINNTVTTYIKGLITMEADNYSPLEAVKKIKDVTTASFYESLEAQYKSYEENKGGNRFTGGTSTEVDIREVYSKEKTNNIYDVIVFCKESDMTGSDVVTSALLYKFKVKIVNNKPLIDDVITEQNFNYGINGIVDK